MIILKEFQRKKFKMIEEMEKELQRLGCCVNCDKCITKCPGEIIGIVWKDAVNFINGKTYIDNERQEVILKALQLAPADRQKQIELEKRLKNSVNMQIPALNMTQQEIDRVKELSEKAKNLSPLQDLLFQLFIDLFGINAKPPYFFKNGDRIKAEMKELMIVEALSRLGEETHYDSEQLKQLKQVPANAETDKQIKAIGSKMQLFDFASDLSVLILDNASYERIMSSMELLALSLCIYKYLVNTSLVRSTSHNVTNEDTIEYIHDILTELLNPAYRKK